MASKVDRVVGQKRPIVSPDVGKGLVANQPPVEGGASTYSPQQSDSVSKLSHDIRTQLYIIIGFAELMLLEIPGKLNEEQRRNLKDVLNSGRRLQALLQDIVAPPGGK
jgi:signal transduction histidine kinase